MSGQSSQGSQAPDRFVSSSHRPPQENGTLSSLLPDRCGAFVREAVPSSRPGRCGGIRGASGPMAKRGAKVGNASGGAPKRSSLAQFQLVYGLCQIDEIAHAAVAARHAVHLNAHFLDASYQGDRAGIGRRNPRCRAPNVGHEAKLRVRDVRRSPRRAALKDASRAELAKRCARLLGSGGQDKPRPRCRKFQPEHLSTTGPSAGSRLSWHR
jgi:hypothetical protein